MGLYDAPRSPLDPTKDPAEEARELRKHGPLVRVEVLGVPAWAATDHKTAKWVFECADLAKDPQHWRAWRDGEVSENWPLLPIVTGGGMAHLDGEPHRRLRRLFGASLRPQLLDSLRPRIARIAGELLDAALTSPHAGDPVDLRQVYAYPLPLRVICEVLGVPAGAVSELREAFDRMVGGRADAVTAEEEIQEALSALIADKRQHPGSDLTTALIQADAGGELSEQELVENMKLLMTAGHETTEKVITSAVYELLQTPGLLAAVRDPADSAHTWHAVVEETLRHAPPVKVTPFRYATRDIEFAGVTIAAGDPVIALLTGAGRDPLHNEDPDRFDITRATRRHLSVGHGAHNCIGAYLARMEATIALAVLFDRYPSLSLASAVTYAPSPLVHGVGALPVYLNDRQAEHPQVA